jgi:hypothetical protein
MHLHLLRYASHLMPVLPNYVIWGRSSNLEINVSSRLTTSSRNQQHSQKPFFETQPSIHGSPTRTKTHFIFESENTLPPLGIG